MAIKQTVTFILVLCFCTTVYAKDFNLAKLKTNETLEISFRSIGCFHNTYAKIIILKTEIYSAEVLDSSSTASISVKLSSDDVENLDRLIEYYRSLEKDGGCTTEDTITLLWSGPDIKAFIEPFTDVTCDAYVPGLMVIQKLAKLIE